MDRQESLGFFKRKRGRWFWPSIRISLVAAMLGVAGCRMVWMPGQSFTGDLPTLTQAERAVRATLEKDLTRLSVDIGVRNIREIENLQKAATFLETELAMAGYEVESQRYDCEGVSVRNLIVERKGIGLADEIVVIGGHYDTKMDVRGANDNGSGAVATVALARRYATKESKRTVRFVLFVNEEPPFFQTELMGSLVYARALQARGDSVVAMLSLETMGYFSDDKGSQNYPRPLNLFYPSTGNFIGFVGDTRSGPLVRRSVRSFRDNVSFPSEGASMPRRLTGIGWSDHWAFWQCGYQACMVTDTAPFRYPYYHTVEDTIDKIDFDRLTRVVVGLESVIDDLLDPEVWP